MGDAEKGQETDIVDRCTDVVDADIVEVEEVKG